MNCSNFFVRKLLESPPKIIVVAELAILVGFHSSHMLRLGLPSPSRLATKGNDDTHRDQSINQSINASHPFGGRSGGGGGGTLAVGDGEFLDATDNGSLLGSGRKARESTPVHRDPHPQHRKPRPHRPRHARSLDGWLWVAFRRCMYWVGGCVCLCVCGVRNE